MRRTAVFVVFLAFVTGTAAVFARAGQSGGQQGPRTSRDRVYTKEQATRASKQYAKLCAACHDPAGTPPAGKDKGPELVGDKFTDEWQDRTLGELLFTIQTTMPNDGSAVLTESETADLVAYILLANKYPDGPTALKYDAGNETIIVK